MNSVCAQGLCLGIGGQPKRICDCSLTQGLVRKQGGGGGREQGVCAELLHLKEAIPSSLHTKGQFLSKLWRLHSSTGVP